MHELIYNVSLFLTPSPIVSSAASACLVVLVALVFGSGDVVVIGSHVVNAMNVKFVETTMRRFDLSCYYLFILHSYPLAVLRHGRNLGNVFITTFVYHV